MGVLPERKLCVAFHAFTSKARRALFFCFFIFYPANCLLFMLSVNIDEPIHNPKTNMNFLKPFHDIPNGLEIVMKIGDRRSSKVD